MGWGRSAIVPRRRVRKVKPSSLWHPCGNCLERYCGKKNEVSRKSVAAVANNVPVPDCPDRVKPYFEALND